MKIYLYLLLTIIVASCSTPKNSLNLSSVPDKYNVINCTDTSFTTVYEEMNQAVDFYLFESKNDSLYQSLLVFFVEDTIQEIICYNNLKIKELCMENLIGFNNKIVISVDTSCQEMSEFISRLKSSSNQQSIKNYKKGHRFEDIEENYHNTLADYFQINYKLFLQDTMTEWNTMEYSNYFNNDMSKIKNVFENIILYYSFFPSRMDNWSITNKKNMKFLIQHYPKSYESISEEIEFWVDKNSMVNVTLLSILQFIIEENPNQYRFIQNKCSSNPHFQWFYSPN